MSYIVTTSHRPSQRTRSFAKELACILPRGVRINRGKKTLEDLFYDALELRAKRVMIIGERKGNPGSITFYEPRGEGLRKTWFFKLRGVTLAREAGARLPEKPSSIGLLLSRSRGVDERMLDAILESFAARLIIRGEQADILVAVYPGRGSARLVFLDRGGRLSGPIIRIKSVERCVESG